MEGSCTFSGIRRETGNDNRGRIRTEKERMEDVGEEGREEKKRKRDEMMEGRVKKKREKERKNRIE